MTRTLRASGAGGACVRKMAPMVGNAMNVRTIAGAIVQASSSRALPRIWGGRVPGSRSRKRRIASRRTAATTTKMAVSHQRICMKIAWL
jgi:hypothetical protein